MKWIYEGAYSGQEDLVSRLASLHRQGFSLDQLMVVTTQALEEEVSRLAQVVSPSQDGQARFWQRQKKSYQDSLESGQVLLFRREKPKAHAIGRDMREALLQGQEPAPTGENTLYVGEEEEDGFRSAMPSFLKDQDQDKEEEPDHDLEVKIQSLPYREARIRYEIEEYTEVLEVPLRRKKAIIAYRDLDQEDSDFVDQEEVILQEERVQPKVQTYKLRELKVKKNVVTEEARVSWDQVGDKKD